MNINKILGLDDEVSFDPIEAQALNEQVISESREVVHQIQNSRGVKTLDEIRSENTKKFNSLSNLYEEYSDHAFEVKLRSDTLFFENILSVFENVDLSTAIGSFFKTVREIYECCNLKPEVSTAITEGILAESVEDQKTVFNGILAEFLDRHFFDITPEKRVAKYMEESKDYAKELIAEGTDTNEAIQHSIKTTLMEMFVKQIAFPRFVQMRIQDLAENTEYAEMFDQERLSSLLEVFEHKNHELSKIVALTI